MRDATFPRRGVKPKLRGLATFAAPLFLAFFVTAQAPPNSTFEVASVKMNKSGRDGTSGGVQPGGRVTLFNIPLRLLIRNAYQLVQDSQIVNAPGWIAVERFDITAKAPGDVPMPQPGNPGPISSMMQSLLADRFRLAVHRETRELPHYVIEPVRRDGTLGPQLHRSTVNCAAIRAARQRAGTPAPEPQAKDGACGFRATGGRIAGGQIVAGGVPVAQLAPVLSQILQQIVVDETGISGDFFFELHWAPDQIPPGAAAAAAATQDGPSLFTAMQEQLGLKLRSTRGPVEVLVIDHVEHLVED